MRDLDGDGVAEAALAGRYSAAALVRWQDIDGGRAGPTLLSVDASALAPSNPPRLGPDLDGDGVRDLWVTVDRRWYGWRGGRDGTVTAPGWSIGATGAFVRILGAADLGGSPDVDLVVTVQPDEPGSSGEVRVVAGPFPPGEVSLDAPLATIVGVTADIWGLVWPGDLDGDGLPELVVAAWSDWLGSFGGNLYREAVTAWTPCR